jgi:hypothetical protein
MSNTQVLQPGSASVVHTALESIAVALRRSGHAVWDALEAHGQARAQRELKALAQRLEYSSPELAAHIRSSLRA